MNYDQSYRIANNIIEKILKRLDELENDVRPPLANMFDIQPDNSYEIQKLKEQLLFWNQYQQHIDEWTFDNE